MHRYRKKPVVIEAVQFLPFKHKVDPKGVCRCDDVPLGGHPHVHTLEGYHVAIDGDWIITGVKGELHPCKPDIFALTYEDANEPTPVLPSREAVEAAIDAICSEAYREGLNRSPVITEDSKLARADLLALIPTAPEK